MSESVVTYDQALEPPGLQFEHSRQSRVNAVACRALDIVVSALALIVLSPLLLVVAIWIRRDTRGPALFRQERLGRDMTRFTRVNGQIAAVIVFLMWVYVQAVILLYGVEFTAAYARLRRGRPEEMPAAPSPRV